MVDALVVVEAVIVEVIFVMAVIAEKVIVEIAVVFVEVKVGEELEKFVVELDVVGGAQVYVVEQTG